MNQFQDRIQICIAKIIQHNRELKNIFEEIYQQGGRVLLVGGAVRDCLMGCIGSDLDFEVYHLTFNQLQDILEKFGKVSFIGKSFGVLRLHNLNADWSIPRMDSYGRKPEVQLNPNMNFKDAFRRRDLTVNAMGIDVYSFELIDPYNGIIDLQHKILKSPDLTFFIHDPLRLFRVMQFAARFEMKVDISLNRVCETMDISDVSPERIWQEFSKLFLKSQRPSIGFKWLSEINRLSEIFPGIVFDDQLYESLDCLASQDGINSDRKLIGLWAFLMQKNTGSLVSNLSIKEKISSVQLNFFTDFLKKYIASHDLIHQVSLVSWYLKYIPFLIEEGKDILYKKLAYFLNKELTLQELSDIAVCWYDQEIVEKFIHGSRQAKVLYNFIEPILTGKDLIEYADGKELGDLLKKAYEIQLEKSIHDKQQLITLVLDKNKIN